MKGPWWALPGIAAIVGTLTIVTAAQGSLTSSRVPLPREVQVVAAGATHQPTTSTTTAGRGPGTQVVPPSRPVVTEQGDAGGATGGNATGGGEGSGAAATGTTTGATAPDQTDPLSGTGTSSTGGTSSAPPTEDPSVTPTTVGAAPPASTTTTAVSTTTTTRPRGERGDH